MKVVIVHLSDMHFGDDVNYTQKNISAIVNALNSSMVDIEHILVIISGDLTYSGKRNQCNSIEDFCKALQITINNRYQISDVRFAVVPGNHDVDYNVGVGDLGRKGLEAIEDANSYEADIPKELEKLEQFYYFAKKFKCFQNKDLLHKKTFNYGETSILVNLVNTAPFSSIEEDKSYHFIYPSDLERLSEQQDCDYVFTVMHHPSAWFNWQVEDSLEKTLRESSDLVFLGHKHYESVTTVTDRQASVNMLAGGELSDQGNWENSEFHVGILETDSRKFELRKYKINGDKTTYLEKDYCQLTLSKDRINPLGFLVRREYLEETINPDQFLIAGSVLDYFVFPLLVEQKDEDKDLVPHEVTSMDEFLNLFSSSKKIFVSGQNDSGKTTLTKAVFAELSSKKATVLIEGSDVGKKFERSVKGAFEEIYGDDPTLYERFKQAEPESLALIVDDIDKIDDSIRDDFFDFIKQRFGMILLTCHQEIELDVRERLKLKHERKGYSIFRIEPFFLDKRNELINKILDIIVKPNLNKTKIASGLNQSLSRQKTLYSWSPTFIVQFVKYYCNNSGNTSDDDGSVFSKVFESNLVSIITPFLVRGLTIDKTLIIVDKIAYESYAMREYPISLNRISETIKDYNYRYDSEVNLAPFVKCLVQARILKEVETGFIFYEKSYYAYFVAREITRRISFGNYDDITHVMECSHMSINSDILLFVTYITDNLNIIRNLMSAAERVVSDWTEYSLSPINVEFMKQVAHVIVEPVQDGDWERDEGNRVEIEKDETMELAKGNDASLFAGESEELSYVQKIMRSISLMSILARALPSFEHMMERQDKEQCVELLYTMPLKIFYAWASKIDEVADELVKVIKEFHECEYRDRKALYEPLKDAEALTVLQRESASLLLDLMNAAFGFATKENTWRFIDHYDYVTAPSYGVEHLMGLEHIDAFDKFLSEALRLLNNKEAQVKQLVQQVTRNYILTSKKNDYKQVQQLNSKVLGSNTVPKQYLIEQQRNQNKR